MEYLCIYKALHDSMKSTSKLFFQLTISKMADICYNPDCLDDLLAYFDNIKSDLLRDLEQADLENSESSKGSWLNFFDLMLRQRPAEIFNGNQRNQY